MRNAKADLPLRASLLVRPDEKNLMGRRRFAVAAVTL
jgi:hypothetical protein